MNETEIAAYFSTIHQLLLVHFNEEELKTLCFGLGVDYDDLPATGRSNKARELVLLLERTGRLAELHKAVTALRPQIAWPAPPAAGDSPPAAAPPAAAPPAAAPPRPRFSVAAGEMQVGKLVQGVHQEGGAPVDWSALLPHLPDADIRADSLAAAQMTQGVHIQAGAAVPLPPEALLQALRAQVDGLGLAAGERQELDAALQAVTAELGKAAPNRRRLLARLDEAAAIVESRAGAPAGHAFLAQLLVLRQTVMSS